MPILVLARHAHATAEPMRDFDRPLTEEGLAEARAAGQFLAQYPLTHLVASPAKRTAQTGEAVVHALAEAGQTDANGQPVQLLFDSSLYEASPTAWIEVISAIPPEADGAYIVGHNPVVWATIEHLAGQSVAEFKPSSVAVFDIPHWNPEKYPVPVVRNFCV